MSLGTCAWRWLWQTRWRQDLTMTAHLDGCRRRTRTRITRGWEDVRHLVHLSPSSCFIAHNFLRLLYTSELYFHSDSIFSVQLPSLDRRKCKIHQNCVCGHCWTEVVVTSPLKDHIFQWRMVPDDHHDGHLAQGWTGQSQEVFELFQSLTINLTSSVIYTLNVPTKH